MARICVVGWHPYFTPQDNGGAASIYKNVTEVLKRKGHEVVTATGTDSGRIHTGMVVDHVSKYEDLAGFLNTFDAVLFPTTAPYSISDHKANGAGDNERAAEIVVTQVHVPFVYWVNGEDEVVDWNNRVYDQNPCCKGVILITEGMEKYHPTQHPHVLYCGGWLPINKDVAILRSRRKENIIVSTARICPEKHPEELCRVADKINAIGYQVHIWGPKMYHFTWSNMQNWDGWEYKGGYIHDDIAQVLNTAKFHWGGLNPWRRIKFNPRCELVTIEAVQFGCIPILNSTSRPYWYSVPVYNSPEDIPNLMTLLEDCAEDIIPEFCDQINRRGLMAKMDQILGLLGVA